MSLLEQVANGGVHPETAARHLRELGAGYQQVMDFAQVRLFELFSGTRMYKSQCMHSMLLLLTASG